MTVKNSQSICLVNLNQVFIKSQRYTGADFMFMCRFVRLRRLRRHRHPQTSHDNLRTTFRISSIFGRINGPDLYITQLDFGQPWSWLWPQIVKDKYKICYISAKNGPISSKQNANISSEF